MVRYLFADEDGDTDAAPADRPGDDLPQGIKEQLGDAGVGTDSSSASGDPGASSGGLIEAVMGGDGKRVREILHADPTAVNRRDPETGTTPLMLACDRDHVDIVTALLAAPGVDLHASDADGLSALHYAVIISSPALVRTLLAAGADPTRVDNDGVDPISMAREDSNDELIAILESTDGSR